MVEPSVAFVIPPDAEAAAAALALVLDVVPVVDVPLFFGRDSTGTAQSNKKMNETSRIHDSYITKKANVQRQESRKEMR